MSAVYFSAVPDHLGHDSFLHPIGIVETPASWPGLIGDHDNDLPLAVNDSELNGSAWRDPYAKGGKVFAVWLGCDGVKHSP